MKIPGRKKGVSSESVISKEGIGTDTVVNYYICTMIPRMAEKNSSVQSDFSGKFYKKHQRMERLCQANGRYCAV
jgi:hypothetical protein